jgi:hypothetical protein
MYLVWRIEFGVIFQMTTMMTLKLKIIINNKICNAVMFDIMLMACCIHL